MYVDNIVEKTSANGVHIPGHLIQSVHNTSLPNAYGTSEKLISYSKSFLPFKNSKLSL